MTESQSLERTIKNFWTGANNHLILTGTSREDIHLVYVEGMSQGCNPSWPRSPDAFATLIGHTFLALTCSLRRMSPPYSRALIQF